MVRFARLIHRHVRALWPAFGRRRLRRQSEPDLAATQGGAAALSGPPCRSRSTVHGRCGRAGVVNSPRRAAASPWPARRPRQGVAMAEDQPGPPGSSNHDDRPGQRPTEPLGGPAQPPAPPPDSGQPGSDPRSPAPTAPLPGGPTTSPAFAAVGPPPEALAGFWRRLVAAFLDWLLVGIVAAAIGELFGVEALRRPRPPATASTSSSSPRLARSFWSSWPTSPTSMPPAPASRSATRSSGSGCWTPTPAGPCPMPGRLFGR
jgi:hypothetical protein